MGNVSKPKSRFGILVRLAGVLVLILALVVLSLLGLNAWWVMLERGGTYHNTTAVADLDGDGDQDVIVMNLRYETESAIWHQVTLWTNQGGGQFTPTSFQTPPFGYLSAAAGDVDGDGDADMALLRSDGLEFFLNQGLAQKGEAGEFRLSKSFRPSGDTGTPGSVVLGDLNDDGEPDAFVAGCCSMFIPGQNGYPDTYIPSISWVWINAWNATDPPKPQTMRLEPLNDLRIRAAALGDLDGDGDLDAFAALLAPRIGPDHSAADMVLINDGSGSFSDSGQRLGDADSSSVALGDLDGDGDLDALVGTTLGVNVWVNQGGAQAGQTAFFAPSGQEFPSSRVEAVFLADLDGDGDLDALTGSTPQVAIWWNDGLGMFKRSPQGFPISVRHGLAVGDFNGDGKPDIFTGVYSKAYKVWLNRGDGKFGTSLHR